MRARYLDTGVGRFINRDTWGGIYEDPLSLNRWMYVQGNPGNWTDPSGHMPYTPPIPWPTPCGYGSCKEQLLSYFPSEVQKIIGSNICSEVPVPPKLKNPPTYLNKSLLSSVPQPNTGVSGVEIYNWYLELWLEFDEWWWDIYGADREFSILDSLAIVMIGESGGHFNDNNLPEAFWRAMHEKCGDLGCESLESLVNSFANYVSLTRIKIDNFYQGRILEEKEDYMAGGRKMGEMLNMWGIHDPSWYEGVPSNAFVDTPVGWGNMSLYPRGTTIGTHLRTGGYEAFASFYPGGNGWFIGTSCTYVYWTDEDNLKHDLSKDCIDFGNE